VSEIQASGILESGTVPFNGSLSFGGFTRRLLARHFCGGFGGLARLASSYGGLFLKMFCWHFIFLSFYD
jgi:hypothetical protein